MIGLGFPIGKIGEVVPKGTIKDLQKHDDYSFVKRFIEDRLEKMRNFRNIIVHAGFRHWDVSEDILKDFDKILTMAAPRIQGYALDAVLQGLESVEAFWEYIPLLYFDRTNLKNDLHGNILFMIKNSRLNLPVSKVTFLNLET